MEDSIQSPGSLSETGKPSPDQRRAEHREPPKAPFYVAAQRADALLQDVDTRKNG